MPAEPMKVAADSLEQSIRAVLKWNLENRKLSGEVNAAWQIMHGVLAYGNSLPLEIESKDVNTLEYLLGGGTVAGWELGIGEMLPSTKRLGMKARLEPGSYIGQGHVDQWIAILSQIDVPLDRKVIAGGKEFTIEDWLRQAQWDVPNNPVREYSWTLIALTRYFPNETSWVARDGKTWTLEPLAAYESKQDLSASACGGMHRLTGLAHAVQFRERTGGGMTGGWKQAKDKVDESIARIKRFQNPDGTFSSNHTERPGTSSDLSLVISSTGHTLEFLANALPAKELEADWVVRATVKLCQLLEITKEQDLDCGGLYHALNGLKVYHQRRFGTSNVATR